MIPELPLQTKSNSVVGVESVSLGPAMHETAGANIESHRRTKHMNKGGWSWKRQFGVTNAKRRVSRATGVPWTKSGRQRKVGGLIWKLFK
jgi:hypothetical protein